MAHICIMKLSLCELKGWERESWVGAPEGRKQHGHVLTWLQKGLAWLALGRPFLSSYVQVDLENSSSHVGPPFLAVKVFFLVYMGCR